MSKVKQWAENEAEKKVDNIIFKLKDGQIVTEYYVRPNEIMARVDGLR